MHREMKDVLEKARIDAEYTSLTQYPLKTSLCARVQTLTLDETVFPAVQCGIGFLEKYYYDDFETLFPELRKIILPEGLGDGLGLRFPSSLWMHIYHCLRNSDGPAALPDADCTELACSDLGGMAWYTPYHMTSQYIHARGISIVSTYRYTIDVAESFAWPFAAEDEMRPLYYAKCCGVSFPIFPRAPHFPSHTLKDIFADTDFLQDIVWDQKSMRIEGIPDLRKEWWYDEWFREEKGQKPDEEIEIDWTAELGGWDMMDLLIRREDDEKRFWTEVTPDSFSFT